MSDLLLTVFIGITAVAIIIQMGVLIALYVSSKKTADRLQVIAKEVEETALPMIRDLRTLLNATGPKIQEVVENLTVTSATVRRETERLGEATGELTNRFRNQAARADEMVTRTLDRVEHTTETVQNAINSPARKISGVMTGVAAGVAEYLGSRKVQQQKKVMPRDEMFI